MERLTTNRDWSEARRDLKQELGYSHIWKRLNAIEDILGNDYDLDRLKEIVEADREGKCVVLPCEIGTTVYSVRHEKVLDDDFRMSSHIERSIIAQKFKLIHTDCIGKNVFLTKEEAEAALRRMQDEGGH